MTKARDLADIIAGGFTADDIPNLDTSKITSGTLNNARISLDANEIPNISTDKLTSGTLPDARIAALSASKLTGSIAGARIDNNSLANVTALPFSAGIDWQSAIKTSSFTAVASQGYFLNTTSSAITVTLPSSPSLGDEIELIDYTRKFATNNLTIAINGKKFQSGTVNPIFDEDGKNVKIVYSDANEGWIPVRDAVVADESVITYTVTYVSVAGGGGGGKGKAAGGGAGGMLTSSFVIGVGATLTAVVGAGGAASSGGSVIGGNGVNSSITGTGMTTVTSIGGGGGGSDQNAVAAGADGGSGGGGSGGTAGNVGGGSGTSGQGNDGGDGLAGGAAGGGGGGGKNAAGQNATSSKGGDGGAGLATSITGSSVTLAGGGGGCNENAGAGAGGAGGGGAGRQGSGTAGTANTGGGGGASHEATAAAGGSGIVILSVPTSRYSNTTSGSPTVSTSGGNTIIKFTGNGTYTT